MPFCTVVKWCQTEESSQKLQFTQSRSSISAVVWTVNVCKGCAIYACSMHAQQASDCMHAADRRAAGRGRASPYRRSTHMLFWGYGWVRLTRARRAGARRASMQLGASNVRACSGAAIRNASLGNGLKWRSSEVYDPNMALSPIFRRIFIQQTYETTSHSS